VTLPGREKRLLRRAERALCRSDPDLASMLSVFAWITAAEGMPAGEQLPSRLASHWCVLRRPVAGAGMQEEESSA
jgi:hypothetical protein